MSFNPRNVVELLRQEYEQFYQPSKPNHEEIEMKNLIKGMLDSRSTVMPDAEVESDVPVEMSVQLPGTSSENNPGTSGLTNKPRQTRNSQKKNETSDSNITDYEDESIDSDDSRPDVPMSYKRNAVFYWKKDFKYAEKPRGKIKRRKNQRDKVLRSFSSVKAIYPKVKNLSELYRWEKTVIKRGTVMDKINRLNNIVHEKFESKRSEAGDGGNVHDSDIRKFGFEAANEIDFPQFKASKRWLENFKKQFKVTSRKITKTVTRQQVTDSAMIKQIAVNFVQDVRLRMLRVGAPHTYNSDQSGFQQEMHTGRTLAPKGSKHVVSVVQSKNATTHSYTIQPVVNAEGKLSPKMLLVLQEPGGKFGVRVKTSLFNAPNLKVVASRSGKCTSEILKDWYQTLFKPEVTSESILLLDAFGGFNKVKEKARKANNEEADEDNESSDDDEGTMVDDEGFTVHIMRIPKHTTGHCQSLDLMGFRPIKCFKRRISDSSEVLKYEFRLSVRNNIIKLQSLVYNQMSSPRYVNMFKYGWYKAGYLDVHPPHYLTPLQYSFDPAALKTCEEEGCTTAAFLRCGWCTGKLCLGSLHRTFTEFKFSLHSIL